MVGMSQKRFRHPSSIQARVRWLRVLCEFQVGSKFSGLAPVLFGFDAGADELEALKSMIVGR